MLNEAGSSETGGASKDVAASTNNLTQRIVTVEMKESVLQRHLVMRARCDPLLVTDVFKVATLMIQPCNAEVGRQRRSNGPKQQADVYIEFYFKANGLRDF
jgi:hypothetical protein